MFFGKQISNSFRKELTGQYKDDIPKGVKVSYKGRHAYLEGKTTDMKQVDEFIDKIQKVENSTWGLLPSPSGTAHVHNQVKVVEPEIAYIGISAYKDRVILSGEVPSVEIRDIILGDASKNYPSAKGNIIDDRIKINPELADVLDIVPTITSFPELADDNKLGVLAATKLGDKWLAYDKSLTKETLQSKLASYPPVDRDSYLYSLIESHLSYKPTVKLAAPKREEPTPEIVATPEVVETVPTKESPLVIANIYFALGEGDISSQRSRALQEVRKVLATKPDAQFEIAGHTCDLGADELNMTLSKKRADEFMGYLVDEGINSGQISSNGYGETSPSLPNSSEENRKKNRRVEIRYY